MNHSIRFSAASLAVLSRAVVEIYRPADRAEFPMRMVRAIEGVFGSDIVTYNEFPTAGGVPFVVSNNGFEKENGALIQEYAPYFTQNPLIAKMLADQGIAPARISDAMPFEKYQRTTIYNDFYHRLEADYQMGCGFLAEEKDTIWAIAVNQKLREFTDHELQLFQHLIPHVQQAYQICRTMERASRTVEATQQVLAACGTGVIVFDDHYRVSLASATARQLVSQVFQCEPREGALLPGRLRGCAERLLGHYRGELPGKREPLRFAVGDGAVVTLRLSFDPERRSHCLMLERERGVPDEKALSTLGLTAREAAVTRWILHDKTSWEVGTILGISPRTVEKHLEKVFAKLQIGDRGQLRDRVNLMAA